ncbi:hypothetical protein AWZ03_006768 [Drosophila navojoa]|uniref:Fibronectin type-III domain-containing protein n=1 Tax=Drosophila navojoa TaxID=7232 RepID=A0A484BDY0_DRONA|nr:hypothetical protein AWZ03_006768 [Drosophila navojoa]
MYTRFVQVDNLHNIHDFECIFLDYIKESGLNCSFTRPIESSSNTNYRLQHLSVDKLCQRSDLSSDRIECNFRSEDFNKFRNQLNFTLRIEDETGSRTENISIDRGECMVLEPPGRDVVELNKTSNSICLQWPNKRFDNHNYGVAWDYQLKPHVSLAWQDPHYARLMETFCLNGLPDANQEYELRMRRRINAVHAHWSDYFTYHFRTQLKSSHSSESAKLSPIIILVAIMVSLNLIV